MAEVLRSIIRGSEFTGSPAAADEEAAEDGPGPTGEGR